MSEFRVPVELLVEQLEKIRTNLGEEAYQQAKGAVIRGLILKPNGEAFLSKAFPGTDFSEFRREAAEAQASTPELPTDEQALIMRLLQVLVPNLKSQAHFNMFMASFDALKTCMDFYFSGDQSKARVARDALNRALDMASDVHAITSKIEEMPAESLTEASKEFVSAPKQFLEYDRQRRLLEELAQIQSMDVLNVWYAESKSEMDLIVSQSLRNELFDAIRNKKQTFVKEVN